MFGREGELNVIMRRRPAFQLIWWDCLSGILPDGSPKWESYTGGISMYQTKGISGGTITEGHEGPLHSGW